VAAIAGLALFGAAFGLSAPAHEALVVLARLVCGADFSRTGRTTEALGLEGLSALEIRNFALGLVSVT
jgi:hypothetical protein